MSAAAENFKATAIANLNVQALVEGWAQDSDIFKAKVRAIMAEAENMATTAAAPVGEPVKKEAKRQDPPWVLKWEDFTAKDFAAAEKMLQQLQRGEWTRDKNYYGYRQDKDKNKCNTRRWVSPDGKTLVRVTEWEAPENMAMGHYDLQTSPSNYRETLVANKEAKVAAKEAKKAAVAAKKEAKAEKAAAKAAKAAAKAAEGKKEGDEEGGEEGDEGKKAEEEQLSPRAARGAARLGAQLEMAKKKAEEQKKAGVQKKKNIKTTTQVAKEKAAAAAAPAAAPAAAHTPKGGSRAQASPPAAAVKQEKKLTKAQEKKLKDSAAAVERAKTKKAKERAAAAAKKKAKAEKFQVPPGELCFSGDGIYLQGDEDDAPLANRRQKRQKVTKE